MMTTSSLKRLSQLGFGLVLLVSASAGVAAEESAIEGATLYHDYCSVCHGDQGDGRSRASGGLFPAPRDFTSIQSAHELTRERMIFSVAYGRPDTAMVGWHKRLSAEQIEVVVDYVRNSFMNLDAVQPEAVSGTPVQRTDQGDGIENLDPLDPGYMELGMPMGVQGMPEWGGAFYITNCADCHGEKGDGKGPRSYFIFPKPRDFRLPASRHQLNRPRLFEAISQGSQGSEMPAWNKVLTHQEIAHVVEYVFQTFIKPGATTPDH